MCARSVPQQPPRARPRHPSTPRFWRIPSRPVLRPSYVRSVYKIYTDTGCSSFGGFSRTNYLSTWRWCSRRPRYRKPILRPLNSRKSNYTHVGLNYSDFKSLNGLLPRNRRFCIGSTHTRHLDFDIFIRRCWRYVFSYFCCAQHLGDCDVSIRPNEMAVASALDKTREVGFRPLITCDRYQSPYEILLKHPICMHIHVCACVYVRLCVRVYM